jgi:type II secretory ATPase GspE/PulE/Tfp pilus assembly ATPase PilB-like protein
MSLEPDFAPELTALVSSAIKADASNLDFLMHHDEINVNFRVNGVHELHSGLSIEQKKAVLTEIHCKLLGHEKVSYDRYEDAVFHLPHEEWQSIRVRLAMAPYLNGCMILMRLLRVEPNTKPVTDSV